MSDPHERLYDLLPGIIRLRDAERGGPLHGLLSVIAEQAARTEDDIRQFYENCFIETCERELIPYIGDLVGYRPLAQAPTAAGWGVPRRDVAETLQLRRRKGSLAVLEEVAAAAAQWPARVTEHRTQPRILVQVWRLSSFSLTRTRPFYQPRRTNAFSFSVLGNDAPLFTGAGRAPAPGAPRTPPMPITRDMLMASLDTYYGDERSFCIYEGGRPVDAARIVVRDLTTWGPEVVDDQIAVDPELGRFLYPEFAPRRTITTSAYYGFAAEIGGGEYRRAIHDDLTEISLFRRGHLLEQGARLLARLRSQDPFSTYLIRLLDRTVLADLLTHSPSPTDREETLDDELNRVLQAADLSAGPLDGLPLDDEAVDLLVTDPFGPRRIRLNRLILEAAYPDAVARSYARTSVNAAIDQRVIMDAIRADRAGPRPAMHLVVELADSGLYVEPVIVDVDDDHALELRAADGCRPTIFLPERSADIDDMSVRCGNGSRFILDGIMVARRPVRVSGQPAEVVVRDCTLVPGWELDEHCTPGSGEEPSLILSDIPIEPYDGPPPPPSEVPSVSPCIRIERSILGSIQVQRNEVVFDPLRIWITDSIVDATDRARVAIAAPNDRHAHATLQVRRSTLIGEILTHAVELGEDAIFFGLMQVARRQIGCLRHCWVDPGSRTPRRYACQPDLAIERSNGTLDPNAVAPRFISVRYGLPSYCRLADDCPAEIRQGASDESEMGVYHDLYQPQRSANLRARLAEFVPLGWSVELTYVT